MTMIKGEFLFAPVEGPLYRAGWSEDGEEIIVCDMWIEAELFVGGERHYYVHNHIIKGSYLNHEDFLCVNRNQINEANSLMNKMYERGSIDTNYWTLNVVEETSLSREYLTRKHHYERLIALGEVELIPNEFEFLIK